MKIRLVGDTLIHAGQTDRQITMTKRKGILRYLCESKGACKLYVKNSQWKSYTKKKIKRK